MNKVELIKVVADKVGFTQKDVSIVYDALLDIVTESLKNGEKVQLAGLGAFELKEVPAKEGINPQTKEKVEIAACKKPVMKFGAAYKALFN